MRHLFLNRTTAVWFGLVAATLLSWEMGHGVGLSDPRQAGAAVIVIAFLKVRYVILDFMEVRHAPRVMRLVGEVWVVAMCCVLVALFWTARGGG